MVTFWGSVTCSVRRLLASNLITFACVLHFLVGCFSLEVKCYLCLPFQLLVVDSFQGCPLFRVWLLTITCYKIKKILVINKFSNDWNIWINDWHSLYFCFALIMFNSVQVRFAHSHNIEFSERQIINKPNIGSPLQVLLCMLLIVHYSPTHCSGDKTSTPHTPKLKY